MRSLFDEKEAKTFVRRHDFLPEALSLRLYTSRLIGKNPNLVLHGGGNTSVKLKTKNILGEDQEVLYVKGSGIDLATLEPEGLVGMDLGPLRRLRTLHAISDEEMDNQLKIRKINPLSPDPSVEALLHAFLSPRYVDHTHADSVLVLTHLKDGEKHLREALGSRVGILPYIHSGLPLAKAGAETYERFGGVEAIIVLYHGIFTFGDDARTSYERMIEYVTRAESYIKKRCSGKSLVTHRKKIKPLKDHRSWVSRTVNVIRGTCAFPAADGSLQRCYTVVRDETEMRDISRLEEAVEMCRSGVLTPDHAIRTKNRAVYLRDVPEDDEELKKKVSQSVNQFRTAYDRYFSQQAKRKRIEREKLDPYPRVFLAAGIGLVTVGMSREAASVAADIAEHTLMAKLRAKCVGEYVPISDSDVFDMEYWGLEQKKLGKTVHPLLKGQIAVITGGGGAIGLGIADRLLANGAAVVLCDIDEARLKKVRSILSTKYGDNNLEQATFDVTDLKSVEGGFTEISRKLGGIDLLIPNAGIAHVARIEDLDPKKFDQVMAVNLRGTFNVIKASVPIFRRQGTGGNMVVISSKNVFDPGAAFGAYSASKAAAHQLSKVAALELAELGVRVNMVNPDAIFGDAEVSSKLWDLVGPERMKSRGLDPEGLREYYRQRNLLKARVLAEHVGNAVVFFASDQTPTTGATLPVDGGIPAAFPR
jgi:rhamnose utilization protein RhaD (predicted bifunctional aldolase and dehydrogenase)/NAD(P)-dependent dehydrogenase (short-subunit alcohol dehydrogenase family)